MPEFLDESSQLEYITPTSYESLRLCSLRKAFSQRALGTAPPLSSFAALGIASHRAIEYLVKTDTLLDPAWESHFAIAWDIQIGEVAPRVAGPPPHLWPRYNLTKARLRLAVGRLRALVQAAGDNVEVTSEVALSADEGSLRGRADLVLRGSSHQVIDIKTGSTTDPRSGDLLPSYCRQLLLYAYMEAESSAVWPSLSGVLSLADADLVVEVDPAEAIQVAQMALRALENYNSIVPGRQPAYVSAESCGSCPYAARCGPFWEAAHGLPGVISVAGTVSSRSHTAFGTTNLRVEASAGLLAGESIVIQGIQAHSSLATAATGSAVWVVGLWGDPARGTYHTRDTASVALS